VAVILNAALQILKQGLPHPPLTFLWTIQEEVGLQGARLASLEMLGKPRLAFNWDGGVADKLTIGATGGYRMEINIRGLASHAGNAPERGVSAIAIAALAIANLEADGWHGSIRQGDQLGTSNIGVIQGGAATNVVTDHVQIMAEARSHDPEFRKQIVRRIEQSFKDAATRLPNDQGRTGSVSFSGRLDYESFRLPIDSACVQSAQAAVRACGGEPQLAIANGGLDANWMSARGIPTVSLGCGQRDQHTTNESLDLRQFRRACQIAVAIATATAEDGGTSV
jgi:tripeptide aminopeptidase